MVYDLYPLPLSLKACEPVDTTDTWYMNQPHDHLINPLKKVLYIKLYNQKWFNILFQTSIPPFTYQHDTLKLPNESIPPFPSVIELYEETNTYSPSKPLFEKVDDSISNPLFPLALHKLLDAIDCCFFIQYTPDDTIKPRSFLVKVNHIETEILKMDSSYTENYHVTFLSRRPVDKHLYDDVFRW